MPADDSDIFNIIKLSTQSCFWGRDERKNAPHETDVSHID